MTGYSRYTFGEDVIEDLEKVLESSFLMKTRIDVFKTLLTLINDGYYDEIFENNLMKEQRINLPSGLSMEANHYTKQYGYKRLSHAIEDILKYELKEGDPQSDLDGKYYKIMKENKKKVKVVQTNGKSTI